MRSTRRTVLLKLAASTIPLAVGLSVVVKKAADYSVSHGDTLSGIAKKNNTTWQELAKLNGLKDPNKLQLGQRIRLPETTPPPPAGTRPLPKPTEPAAPKAPTETLPPQVSRLNQVSAHLHKRLNNPNLESAILANFNRETGGQFDYRTKEVGGGGYGLPQYTGPSLKAYRGWLAKNKLKDSATAQIDYFVDSYMPTRAGYKTYLAPDANYTREQYADWLHRRVFTPAHTIRSNAGYSRAKIIQNTLAHNAFMRNKLKAVNGVWQGV